MAQTPHATQLASSKNKRLACSVRHRMHVSSIVGQFQFSHFPNIFKIEK